MDHIGKYQWPMENEYTFISEITYFFTKKYSRQKLQQIKTCHHVILHIFSKVNCKNTRYLAS